MRRSVVLFAIIAFFAAAFAAWEPLGPYGGCLGAFAAAVNESALYASSATSPAVMVKSTDTGASWFNITSINDYVYSLAVDPTNANIVYAGAYNYVYKSTNGGATWQSYSLAGSYANNLAINPSNPSVIYASGYYYNGSATVAVCQKSTNAGVTWTFTQLSTVTGMTYGVTVDPGTPANVYAGGYFYNTQYNPCVYKSTNGGTSFTECTNGFPSSAYYIQSVRVHPTNGSIVYAGSYYAGIFRTTNAGANWTGSDPSFKFITSLAAAAIAPDVCYAGGDTLIYKTTNAGATWVSQSLGFGGQAKSNRTVWASPNTASLVMTTDAHGFFKSTSGGSSWFESNHGIAIAAATALACAPSAAATLYTEYEGVGVFRTTDNGDSWARLPTPLECGSICEFAVHRTDPNTVLGLEGLG